MNPARLQLFIEAYCQALHAEIKLSPISWLRFPGDTAEQKAVRVATDTHALLAAGSIDVLQTDSPSYKRACAALGIEQTNEAIGNYLEGA